MRHALLSFLLAAAAVAVAIFLFRKAEQVKLVDPPDMPRPPVTADPTAPVVSPLRFDDVGVFEGDALREEHNRMVARMEAGLAAWRTGSGTLREVERLEAKLLTIRHQLEVLDSAAWHAGLARIVAREEARLAMLAEMDPPLAGPFDLRIARVVRLRHERGAGQPAEGYEALREEVLRFKRRQLQDLPSSATGRREHLEDEILLLEAKLPAPDAATPTE